MAYENFARALQREKKKKYKNMYEEQGLK